MVLCSPDAMEDAIDALAIGQVSDAVETDAGTHFILLKQRTAAAQVSDEVLRAEIEDNLRSAQSQRDLLFSRRQSAGRGIYGG